MGEGTPTFSQAFMGQETSFQEKVARRTAQGRDGVGGTGWATFKSQKPCFTVEILWLVCFHVVRGQVDAQSSNSLRMLLF